MNKKDKDEDTCSKVLLEYLTKQNRPYNAGDIESNLKKDHGFGKSLVTRVLESLSVEGKVKEKTYGKQKIYFVVQTSDSTMSEEEITKMEHVVNMRKAEISDLAKEIKEMETAIHKRLSRPSAAQLRKDIAEEKEAIVKLKTKLGELKEITKGADPEKQKALKKKRDLRVGEWRKRKRIAMGILDTILEGYPKSKKALIEEIGQFDTDEDAGVSLPHD